MTLAPKRNKTKPRLALSLFAALAFVLLVVSPALAQLTQKDIDALREKGKQEGWTFTVGLSGACQYSLDQLCGDRADFAPKASQHATLPLVSSTQALPSRWDWRDYDGVTPVKNQGQCGSCWAFGTVGPLEAAIRIRDGITVDLSEQWLVSCNRDGMNCVDGGYPAHDYHDWKNDQCGQNGAVLETYFPYAAADLPCANCPYPHDYWIEGWGYVGDAFSIPPTDDIKEFIMVYGALYSSFHVNAAFQGYSGGVFNSCEDEGTNHAMNIVGWDDDYLGQGVWIVKNSWGTDWGDSGYVYIPYGCSRIGYRANYVDYNLPGVIFWADTTFGWVPVDINFGAISALDVDTWTWDFGDGDSAFVQNPSTHTYDTAGAYDVSLQVNAGGQIRTATKLMYIIAAADTIHGADVTGPPDSDVELVVTANNSAPVNYIKVPVEFGNTFNMTYDSFSTEGCRTSYFEVQDYTHYDPWFGKKLTLRLMASQVGTSPELEPGSGPIVKLYFSIPASATDGQSATIYFDGYDTYLPYYYGSKVNYQIPGLSGSVTVGSAGCCEVPGDINHDGQCDGMDVVYFVDWLWNMGPDIPCPEEADADGSGQVDPMDLTKLVDYIWNFGPEPAECP